MRSLEDSTIPPRSLHAEADHQAYEHGRARTEPVGDRPRVGSCRLTRLQPRQVRILTGHTTEHGNGWHPWSWALGSREFVVEGTFRRPSPRSCGGQKRLDALLGGALPAPAFLGDGDGRPRGHEANRTRRTAVRRPADQGIPGVSRSIDCLSGPRLPRTSFSTCTPVVLFPSNQ